MALSFSKRTCGIAENFDTFNKLKRNEHPSGQGVCWHS